MAYLDTASLGLGGDRLVWEGAARLDAIKLPGDGKTLDSISAQHRQFVQQMLVAAMMTAGAILAVAAMMMLMAF